MFFKLFKYDLYMFNIKSLLSNYKYKDCIYYIISCYLLLFIVIYNLYNFILFYNVYTYNKL